MEELKLTFINVGYGEAILLECPDPRSSGGVFTMLIDGGSAESSEYADRSSGRVPLAEYLAARQLDHLDLLVSTHIHEDHICALLPAARDLPPAAFWQALPADVLPCMTALDETLAETPSQSKFLRALNDYRTLRGCLEQRGTPIRTLVAGDEGQLCEGLRFRVLAPSAERESELASLMRALYAPMTPDDFRKQLSALDARMNNFSLMLALDYRGTRILLPGDTNREGYGGIASTDLRADLFKVGHHGQRDGVSRELAEAIRPKAAVCCASSDRRYNSAHPDALDLLTACGAQWYFSDCPETAEGPVPPHQALVFTIGANGKLNACYQ